MKKILHITNWYPNKWDDIEGIFIKKQFELFKEDTDSFLINVQVRNFHSLFKFVHTKYSSSEEGYYILTSIKKNKIIEILSTLLLVFVLIKVKTNKKFDLIHFHIAYPLLVHYNIWKRMINIPILLSEHWSAYHFNFYLPKDSKSLNKIKNIFRQKIPIVTVSTALYKDIVEFSDSKSFLHTVIPNVVNYTSPKIDKTKSDGKEVKFFILNIWRKIKNPFPMLKAFLILSKMNYNFQLFIGGYGELIPEMKLFVENSELESKVNFLGKLNKEEIDLQLSNTDAYLYSSTYETFSVACAEALLSGCPLIGPKIPAIMEYTNSSNAISFDNPNSDNWLKSLEYFLKNKNLYKKQTILENANNYFSNEKLKNSYLEFLSKIYKEKK